MAPNSFEAASKRAEGWINTAFMIARHGEHGSVDSAYRLLELLRTDFAQHGKVIEQAIPALTALSEGPIQWPEDRGYSAVLMGGTVSCWSSAHEAAAAIVRVALDLLYWPAIGDGKFDEANGHFIVAPVDKAERHRRAAILLAERWKAIAIPNMEVAALQERMRRERAKVLATNDQSIVDYENRPAVRLTVNLPKKQITLDGKEYDVRSDNALRWVRALARHPGDWVSGADLKEHDQELDGVRTDKQRRYLPAEILGLIDSETGKGSRIRL